MKISLIHHRQLQVCAALLAADGVVFTMVNPSNASALWLIGGYLLLGVTFLALALLLAQSFRNYGQRVYRVAWRTLVYGAAALILVVGLQSVGQLTVRDIVTLMPFTVLAYWYFGYSRRRAVEYNTNK